MPYTEPSNCKCGGEGQCFACQMYQEELNLERERAEPTEKQMMDWNEAADYSNEYEDCPPDEFPPEYD